MADITITITADEDDLREARLSLLIPRGREATDGERRVADALVPPKCPSDDGLVRFRVTLTPTDDTGSDTISQERLLREVRMHGDPKCSDSPIARVLARVLGLEFPRERLDAAAAK